MPNMLPLPQQFATDATLALTRHRHGQQLLTRSQGIALGQTQRNHRSLAELGHVAERPEGVDALTIYRWSNRGRVADLVPLRAQRMQASPYAFYRGLPALMLYDQVWEAHSGLFQHICGDCHLLNFGGFASPERNLLFGVNDFDEVMVGPFEWDLKRFATSVVIAAPDMGLSEAIALEAIGQFCAAYQGHLQHMMALSPLQIWYDRVDAQLLLDRTEDQRVRAESQKKFRKGRDNGSSRLLPKLTEQDPQTGFRRFIDEPPVTSHPEPGDYFYSGTDEFFSQYRDSLKFDRQVLFDRYQLTDVAHKVVGVGSVGTRTAVALFEDADREPLILQMKQARPSILAPLFTHRYRHQGQRVVHGQLLMQAASDIFLGYAGRRQHYVVRQLRDMKVSFDLEDLTEAADLLEYADRCGLALAHAHAKAGNADVLMGYLGEDDQLTKMLQTYAQASAERTRADYEQFVQAITDGRVAVMPDVED